MDFDFLSSNLHIAYPFRDYYPIYGSEPLVAGDIAEQLAYVRICTKDTRQAELYIDTVEIFSTDSFVTAAAGTQFVAAWNDDDVPFTLDATNSTITTQVYGRWCVATWVYTGVIIPAITVRLIFPLAVVYNYGGGERWAIVSITEDLLLQPTTILQKATAIDSISLKQGDVVTELASVGEELNVAAGFNTALSGEQTTELVARPPTLIDINAVPGDGTGKYLQCPLNQYLLTLSGVAPDARGNVNFKPELCYWNERGLINPPTPIVPEHGITYEGEFVPYTLKLHNACGPCCSCDDYIATYNHMREMWNRARTAAEAIDALRDRFNRLKLEYETYMASAFQTLSLIQRTGEDLLLGIVVLNNTEVTVSSLAIALTFTLPEGVTALYEPDSASLFTMGNKQVVVPPVPSAENTMGWGFDIPPSSFASWSGIWVLNNIVSTNACTVALTITGDMEKGVTKTLTWQ